MAKQANVNHVALELASLEKKVTELRDYLDSTHLKSIPDDDKRHAEIRIQLLIVEKLGPIVSQLDDLKRKAEKEDASPPPGQVRGDAPLSPLEEGMI